MTSSSHPALDSLTLSAARCLAEPVPGHAEIYVLRGELTSLNEGSQLEGYWCAGSLQVQSRRVPFVAHAAAALEVGRIISAEGTWARSHEVGVHFVISTCREAAMPTDRAGVIRYLAANVDGLGVRLAEKVTAALGLEGVVQRILRDPDVVHRVFARRRAEEIERGVRAWAKEVKGAEWALKVAPQLLAPARIEYTLARRIASFFDGPEAADIVVRRYPYRLLELSEIGWDRADAIARQGGVARDSEERLDAGLRVSLLALMAEQGHTAIPVAQLLAKASALTKAAHKSLKEALVRSIEYCHLEPSADGATVSLPEVRERDYAIVDAVDALLQQRFALTFDERKLVDSIIERSRLNSDQADAVRLSLGSGVSVITGGAGTGKTHTLRSLVACARAMGINVRIVAPTGKAAARAAEITGVAATTIHRLLGAPVGGTRAAGPIRGGLLVVEEASMLGQDVAAWLAINIKPSGSLRMVFLGDDQQLPSVAPGRILSDLVQSGVVPIARLTAVHRQRGGSRIVQQANRVLRGEPLLDGETHDWTHVELPADAGDARALVLRTVRDVIAQERHSVLRDTTFDPRREMQVLSPTAVGALGSVALNSGLRAILNARGELGPFLHGHQQARVGDRVVCMRNDYSVFPQGLMNGEQGVVRAMSGQEITTLLDDGRVVRTRGVQNSRLALGFASTVHRAQGSEYPVVVLVYHRTHGRLLDRRLFYTAITRAKQRVILCADPAALEASAAGVRLMQRQSELLARLRTRIAMRAG